MMIGSYWFRTFCTLVLFYGTRIVYLSRAKPTAGAKMMHHTNRHGCALVGCLHENTISGRVLVCDKICARKYEKRKSFGCLRGVPWEIAKAKCCNVGWVTLKYARHRSRTSWNEQIEATLPLLVSMRFLFTTVFSRLSYFIINELSDVWLKLLAFPWELLMFVRV